MTFRSSMLPGRNAKNFLLRLRRASFREMVDRLRQEFLFFRLKRPALSSRLLPKVPEIDEKDLRGIQLPALQGHLPPETVQGLMEGEVFCLGGNPASIARFEAESRGRFFADLQLGGTNPDIRLVWEPARLQNITALLFSSGFHGEGPSKPAAVARAKETLFAWMKKNPFPRGPHYLSAMECGLRIPVFVYALKLMDLSPEERREVLHSLHRHAWWISKRLSLYASRGNHTVCEALGLVFAGVVFRSFPEGDRWLSLGVGTLRTEISHQILRDGGPVEQSLGYQRLILDVYWLALDFLRKNGIDLQLEWKPLLDSGERFLEAFRNGSYLPAIGDSDDGCAVAPGIHPARTDPANKRNGLRKAEER